ncbi:hypothetical protein B0H12DRAFT_1108134 [Mycena haematopus]|nr:hypothetical protein B0H12DRAFT_1108134 [Mycena haematopus]
MSIPSAHLTWKTTYIFSDGLCLKYHSISCHIYCLGPPRSLRTYIHNFSRPGFNYGSLVGAIFQEYVAGRRTGVMVLLCKV